jgi:hypothetical protein
MPRELKVFGYTGHRREAYKDRNVHGQTREVIATTTKAEAHRMSGLSRALFDRSVSITGNEEEVALAMSSPGTVFWQPDNYPARTGEWVAFPPAAAE